MKALVLVMVAVLFSQGAQANLCHNAQTSIEIHECLATELAQRDDQLVEILKARGGAHDITAYQQKRLASCKQKTAESAGHPVYGSVLLECLIDDVKARINKLQN